jgi:ribosome biogenesis GTPase A
MKPRKEVILVLTKSDLVDPSALEGWKKWAQDCWGEENGEIGVVAVRSYDEELLYEGI